ncbi:hypothetical protein PFISCL1PPCAC_1031, partial [Pristionchus fissidentatus]
HLSLISAIFHRPDRSLHSFKTIWRSHAMDGAAILSQLEAEIRYDDMDPIFAPIGQRSSMTSLPAPTTSFPMTSSAPSNSDDQLRQLQELAAGGRLTLRWNKDPRPNAAPMSSRRSRCRRNSNKATTSQEMPSFALRPLPTYSSDSASFEIAPSSTLVQPFNNLSELEVSSSSTRTAPYNILSDLEMSPSSTLTPQPYMDDLFDLVMQPLDHLDSMQSYNDMADLEV